MVISWHFFFNIVVSFYLQNLVTAILTVSHWIMHVRIFLFRCQGLTLTTLNPPRQRSRIASEGGYGSNKLRLCSMAYDSTRTFLFEHPFGQYIFCNSTFSLLRTIYGLRNRTSDPREERGLKRQTYLSGKMVHVWWMIQHTGFGFLGSWSDKSFQTRKLVFSPNNGRINQWLYYPISYMDSCSGASALLDRPVTRAVTGTPSLIARHFRSKSYWETHFFNTIIHRSISISIHPSSFIHHPSSIINHQSERVYVSFQHLLI